MKRTNIILLIILSIIIVGCSSKDIQTTKKKDDNKIKYEDVILNKDNIDFKGIVLDNGKVLINVVNTNKEDKEIRLDINYLNKDKENISTSKMVIYNIKALGEAYVLVNDIPKEFASYAIVPSIYDTSLVSVSDISSSSEESDKGVKVNINNKLNNKVLVDVGVLYYDKDNNIVGYEYDASMIDANKKKEFLILHPYDRDYNVIEYDHFKEVINQSYILDK